ncbi:DNA-binding transcriptional ArsR family regulator [Sphingomonas sp. UYAg733]
MRQDHTRRGELQRSEAAVAQLVTPEGVNGAASGRRRLVAHRLSNEIVRFLPNYLDERMRITIVRYMPNQSALVAKFAALGDPTRLAIVDRLAGGPCSVTELAEPFAMRLPSFMQHLRMLEASGMVASTKAGRVRTFRLEPASLKEAERWIGQRSEMWARRLDDLGDYLEATTQSTTREE